MPLLHFFIVLVAQLANPVPAPATPTVTRSAHAMGTELRITIATSGPGDELNADKAIAAAFDEIRRIEAVMTTWRDDSEISRINAAAGIKPVKVSDETITVIDMAQKAARLSGGAFDISFYALHGVWKFDEDMEKSIPTPDELAKKLKLVDYRQIVVDHAKKTVFLRRKGMGIGLGGIAKGYAVDRATEILRKAGFPNAIVQAGGDLMCAGSKGGQPWTAGIRDPRAPRDEWFAVMRLTNHAFSTAGDYERSFFLDGKRYHHILDPHTGYPATRSRSVTIYPPNALLADALDDAVFIIGWQKGLELVDQFDDVGAVVVDDHSQVHISKRLADKVTVDHPPTDAP